MTGPLQPRIRDAFLSLADTLEQLPAAWDSASLCEAWRVREVVAHISAAARYLPEQFLAEVQADGGDLNRTVDRIAGRDGNLDPGTLLANLRDGRLHRWTPPGGGEQGALNHVVIHSLDITVPLGVDHKLPDDTLRIVLDALAGGGVHTYFGVHVDGLELRATDLDWGWGRGELVTGTAAEIAVALCGRRIQPIAGRLVGDRAPATGVSQGARGTSAR